MTTDWKRTRSHPALRGHTGNLCVSVFPAMLLEALLPKPRPHRVQVMPGTTRRPCVYCMEEELPFRRPGAAAVYPVEFDGKK